MFGIIAVVAVLLLLGPVAVMLGGALWSAAAGQGLADEADETAKGAAA